MSGSWSGTIQLLRATDGGTTKLPVTAAGMMIGTYTGAGVGAPWTETESGATFYLSCRRPASPIAYRMSQ